MKSKLLIVFFVVAFLAVGAQAQDTGITDTIDIVLSVDTTALTATLEVYVFTDQDQDGLTAGFVFNYDDAVDVIPFRQWAGVPKDHFVIDTAYASAEYTTAFDIGPFLYENDDISVSNANNRVLIGGARLFSAGFPADAGGRRLIGTWEFTISQWDGFDADGIIVDTLGYSGGSELLFQPIGGSSYKPYYTGNEFFGASALSVDDDDNPLPDSYALSQNYPNPFNPSTEIAFDLPTKSQVKLTVYNILGQQVTTLVDREMDAGSQVVTWDASEQATGVYFYKIEANDFTETRKMMLLK
jgi:hypothetical protein